MKNQLDNGYQFTNGELCMYQEHGIIFIKGWLKSGEYCNQSFEKLKDAKSVFYEA